MNGREITAAAIQMSSTPNKGENLDTAERLIRSAASSGAGLIALPELWNCHGLEDVYRENAEPVPGPTTEFLGELAQELGVYLIGGSILEGEPSSTKLHNTSTFFGPDGRMSAVYRKIHLFDVKAPDRQYLESRTIAAGTEIVTAKAGAATVGSLSATTFASQSSTDCWLCAAPRYSPSLPPSRSRRARTTGSFCCGRVPWRTRLMSSLRPSGGGRPTDDGPTEGQSSSTRGVRCSPNAPTATDSRSPPWTSTTSTASARNSRPCRTAAPKLTTGRRVHDAGSLTRASRGGGVAWSAPAFRTGSRTRLLSSSRCGSRAPGGIRRRLEMGPGLVLLRREHDRD
jgi:hypothetical protein